MKISAHTLITNPETMGYPYVESIKSFAAFCDEVIVVDGGTTDGSLEKIRKIPNVKIIRGDDFGKDFWWGTLAKNINKGYLACKGDWAFHFDVDYIFRGCNVKDLFRHMDENRNLPAIELYKKNYVLVSEFYGKIYIPLLVNKKEFNSIRYGIGKEGKNDSLTFLRPISREHTREDGLEEGMPIKMQNCRVARIDVPVYTYDFTFMTKEQVTEQRQRFDTALHRFKDKEYTISPERAFKIFLGMMKERHKLCKSEGQKGIKVLGHSKFIRDKVANITPEMFGYDGWGLIK